MNRFNVQYPMSNIQCSRRQGFGRARRPCRAGLFPWILKIDLLRFWLTGTVRPARFAPALLLLALLATLPASAAEPSARASFDAGLAAFAASNWPAASNAFLEAAAAAPAAKLDPAAAYYNAGLAAYAGGDLKAAADSFARASAGSDLRLQSRAYYNRGNALFHQVGGPAAAMPAAPTMPLPGMSTQELAGAEASVGEAIQMYENAIALDPKDVDAKANYELAVLKQQQIQQQKQQQQDQQQKNQDQQKQDQQKQDQQKQDQQNQEDQKDQKQDQQQQQQQAQPQPQPENQPGDKQQQEEEQIKQDKPSEEMTPEEAAMMLDSMKAQEQSQRDRLHPFFGRPVPVEKDW